MNYYLAALKKYTVFSGRARRSEYWFFTLFNFIFMLVAMGLDNLLNFTFMELPYGFLYFGYALLMIIPGISVFVRRMHDINKSGWWYFIALIPIIGGIWLLVLCLTEGTHGDNEYGPDPKA